MTIAMTLIVVSNWRCSACGLFDNRRWEILRSYLITVLTICHLQGANFEILFFIATSCMYCLNPSEIGV